MKAIIVGLCLLMILRNVIALRRGFALKGLFLLLFWVALATSALWRYPPLQLLAVAFLVLGLVTPRRGGGGQVEAPRETKIVSERQLPEDDDD